MELIFVEKVVPQEHQRNGVQKIWEVEKFPFKIRVGETLRGSEVVYYWTLMGTYSRPEVVLATGKRGSRPLAESDAAKALEDLLVDLKEWVQYTLLGEF